MLLIKAHLESSPMKILDNGSESLWSKIPLNGKTTILTAGIDHLTHQPTRFTSSKINWIELNPFANRISSLL